jgi:hypothetical protein
MVYEVEIETNKRLDFEIPATLRKWPSLQGERIPLAAGARSYLVFEGTLDQCINRLSEKPASSRPLHEIETEPQGLTLATVLSADDVQELVRLREFL